MSLISVPVCVKRVDEMPDAITRAAEVADIIELRLDCISDVDERLRFLRTKWATVAQPVILTLRSMGEGGHASLDSDERAQFWLSCEGLPEAAYVDLELDLVEHFVAGQLEQTLPFAWSQVICSHHNFNRLPEDLDQMYKRMAATPAKVIKLAVHASDAIDCLPIFSLLERAQRERRDLIAIAMGPAGVITRILGPSRGSFLTYGSLNDESATAPGQVTSQELRDVYRIDRVDAQTEVFGIVGNPVTHSLSPRIHNAAFAAASLNAVYVPLEVHDLEQFMRRMAHPRSRELNWNLRGLSVTAPHKSKVMSFLDSIDPIAKEIGAVNTIIAQNDRLLGHNTDAEGFISPLRHRFGSLQNARCAVIGSGGGARAALWALGRAGAETVLFARNPDKAKAVAESFNAGCRQLANAKFGDFDIVINATPLGTRDANQELTPADAEDLRGVRLAYDLVYNPLETRFIREARIAGCVTLCGIEMLLAQAVAQFNLWTGRDPDTDTMRRAAVSALKNGNE